MTMMPAWDSLAPPSTQ
ncbi:hypothetical protein E2C01_101826 [Portunus trituberculatus]|uniref:Uncharacterized protein n=1 Tax=Portunus trituberculatus TaxID=210409 RepID=A0A5B7KH01_PORTR|nr:hypothetical protein [Portunus trituberculatus]